MIDPRHVTSLRPLAVGETLEVAIQICTREWRVLVPITLVIYAPISFLIEAAVVAAQPAMVTVAVDPFAAPGPVASDQYDAATATALVGLGVLLLAGLLVQGALFRALADAYLGVRPTVSGSVRFSLGRIGWILVAAFVMWVVQYLALLRNVLPGVWLWARLSLTMPALLAERIRGGRAIRRSLTLVQGAWWRVFGLLPIT